MILEIKTEDILFSFIHAKLGYEVKNTDTIFNDIGVDGIDAETFFNDFSEEFKVDMSNFDFNRYFIGDGNVFSNIIKYWGKKKSFTVGHLLKVIKNKEWFDPI